MEVNYLYGLHRDQEALAAWEKAARRPEVTSYVWETARGSMRLLTRMGMSKIDALGPAMDNPSFTYFAQVRQTGHIGMYEGVKAMLEGRPAEARGWLDSTVAVGETQQESAHTIIEYLVGGAIEGMGISPAWQWHADRKAGRAGEQVRKGTVYYGPWHANFVQLEGQAACGRAPRPGWFGKRSATDW